ncbi:hypothetical protein OM076_00980 [Solirubrobacter ginsenosidimutans]|uniref:Uncharacterized protein n=1 Tax=Solirubrobacter ginsenosidimutans TaxID=490573 RepID=A0A9X3RZF7_9ACTN|nr:hypothetical protein [Solirubrobacter ginsenosidimutans]MDA0158822.1 hypothetical protein [Solirubrobacter ginsenosidimutans]
MKAARATVEHRLLAVVNLVGGSVALALALSGDKAAFDTFAAVFVALMAIAIALATFWMLRSLRRAEPFPDWATRARGVGPSQFLSAAMSAAVTVFIATAPSPSTWIVAVALLAIGLLHLCTAMLAARVERRMGSDVLRFENRYFLAH